MPITLTPEQESRVTNYASRTQKPIECVLDDLIDTLAEPQEAQQEPPTEEPQRWGAKVVAYLREEGIFGTFGDRAEDSPELARKFARIAEGKEER